MVSSDARSQGRSEDHESLGDNPISPTTPTMTPAMKQITILHYHHLAYDWIFYPQAPWSPLLFASSARHFQKRPDKM
jgi:hypothetical protein